MGLINKPSHKLGFFYSNKDMKVIDPGYVYEFDNGTTLSFRGGNYVSGITSEEMIEVLIHRITTQNKELECNDNYDAIDDLLSALNTLKARHARIEAGKLAAVGPFVLVRTNRIYQGGSVEWEDEINTLTEAIELVKVRDNPIGYDIYKKVLHTNVIQHPVWSFHTQESYAAAVDQLDPLHEGYLK